MSLNNWLKKNTTSLKHKNIVITGTTNGLGLETLKLLARLEASVIVGVRNTARAEEQKREILKNHPLAEITILKIDLSDARSIKDFANRVNFLCSFGIDALINNAGVFSNSKEVLSNGHERHFFTNFVAPIYLSKTLLPLLEMKPNSKIIFLSSISKNFTKINFDDFEFKNNKKDIAAYANSKRLLTYAAMKLKEESKDVHVNIVHPGVSPTALFSNSSFKIFSPLLKLMFPSAKKACLNEVAGLFFETKQNEWIGPRVFNIWGKPKKTKNKIKNFNQSEFDKCHEKTTEILTELP